MITALVNELVMQLPYRDAMYSYMAYLIPSVTIACASSDLWYIGLGKEE
jgi:hypothetical protein